MILEHSGQTVSIARENANPTALLATAFIIATISLALMKLKEPAKISIPPQPARARVADPAHVHLAAVGQRERTQLDGGRGGAGELQEHIDTVTVGGTSVPMLGGEKLRD